MSEYNTIIDVPINPEEIGVNLPPSSLRRIDFSALDFESLRRSLVEYVRTYFPEDFNDFVNSNGFMMLMEIVANVGNIMSERSDIIADEAFLPTAQSRSAVANHLNLIGQELRPATAASVQVECSLSAPSSSDVSIQPGLAFSISGPDGSPVNYEIFRSPGDYTSNITIPKSKRGVIAYGIEGKFASPIIKISNGEPNQYVDITDTEVLSSPIFVEVASGNDEYSWSQVDFLEQANANDDVFEVKYLEDRTRIIFGDDINGKVPISGQIITIKYRIGGGIRGRIGSGIIDETRPISQSGFATKNVLFRNPEPSIGGQDQETLVAAKRRAPRTYAVHDNVATSSDYISVAETFVHQAFGSVQKASASVRTGIDQDLAEIVKKVRAAPTDQAAEVYLLGNYVNRNIVELYILQEGDDTPVAPNQGLKQSLKTKLQDINVFTDEIRVYDGSIRTILFDATIVISRNVDANVVKEQINSAVESVFDISEIEMGEGFYRSDLITAIANVDGVSSVDLYEPADDYPSLGTVIDPNIPEEDRPHGIGVNELYVLGSQNVRIFLERSNLNT